MVDGDRIIRNIMHVNLISILKMGSDLLQVDLGMTTIGVYII